MSVPNAADVAVGEVCLVRVLDIVDIAAAKVSNEAWYLPVMRSEVPASWVKVLDGLVPASKSAPDPSSPDHLRFAADLIVALHSKASAPASAARVQVSANDLYRTARRRDTDNLAADSLPACACGCHDELAHCNRCCVTELCDDCRFYLAGAR